MSRGMGTRLPNDQVPQARILPGFENIRRFWDKSFNLHAARLLPGEYYVTASNELIITVLGSCISACIRDQNAGVGGMNHFMLPETKMGSSGGSECINTAARYGNYAMEHLINDILSNGGSRENLEIKLFGGGQVLASMADIGLQNIRFVRDYLRTEGLPTTCEDLGGTYSRKVLYFPDSGRVLVHKVPVQKAGSVIRRELDYQKTFD